MIKFRNDYRYPVGAKFHVEGDSKDMWIHDYNVRVCTTATVEYQPRTTDRKVFVYLEDIDGDKNVWTRIKKETLKESNRIND